MMPAGVWPDRKSKELKRWGLVGTVAIGKRMFLFKGGAAAASHVHLLVAVGVLEPRVTRQDLSTEARNWYFNVQSDFKWWQLITIKSKSFLLSQVNLKVKKGLPFWRVLQRGQFWAKDRAKNESEALCSGSGRLAVVHLVVPAQVPEVVTLTAGVPDMGPVLLVSGFFRRNGALLGTTFLLFALMLLKSLFILGKKSKYLSFAQGEGKLLPAPRESCHTLWLIQMM